MKLSEYESALKSLYKEFAETVRSLLKDAITKREGIPRHQSTKAREKGIKSLKDKLDERGLLTADDIENKIKDIAGVRLVFYTDTDVDSFLNSRLIPDTFNVDWPETRIHHPIDENDQQRYQAIHYTVSLTEEHLKIPEYEKFKGMRCEIQIQTILGHAWAETYHVVGYKAPRSSGFGAAALESLDKRMKKIMDQYLRPAGYEFQKVQKDYDDLMQGKALFDRGALETLEKCSDNNERHEVLSTFAEHVIPYYDDIKDQYPAIRLALEGAVRVARSTVTKPIESPIGNFPGKTSQDVASVTVGILANLRYVDIVGTFHSLMEIYKGEQDRKVRKQIIDAIRRLAEYNLDVWKQAGPYMQERLADAIEGFPSSDLDMLRPIILMVWHELLKSDMDSSSFSADKVTLNSTALPVFDGMKAIRNRAIKGLIILFDASSSETDKRSAVSALREVTRLPGRADCSNELRQLVLDDTKNLTELLAQRAAGQPYELLEYLEHEVLGDYRRAWQFTEDENDRFGCKQVAESVIDAALNFRDIINTDPEYVRYKTLVGFQSVFAPHWEDEEFDFRAAEKYRMEQVDLYVNKISDESAEGWYRLIRRCVATKSDDMATFPVFGEFLRRLSKAKPLFALMLTQRNDAGVMAFLPEILIGLFESDAQDEYFELKERYISQGVYLPAIASHCRAAKKAAASTVKKVLKKAIEVDEIVAVFECIAFAIEHHDAQELPLIDDVFIPAIKNIARKQDARWIRGAYYLRASGEFYNELPLEGVELVLKSLLALNTIGHEAERVLTNIAASHPAPVLAFFKLRFADKRESEERYEAIPYQFHGLEQQLAKDTDFVLTTLRGWYRTRDDMFRFTGGRMLHAIFPAFTDKMADSLNQIIARGSDEDFDFAVNLLENYRGETAVQEVVQELIARLPENDPKLNRLDICLSNTGGVWGAFGMVEVYREKKEQMSLWLEDCRPKVREFAASYIRRMEQRIASEQRSAEIRNELRKRDYEIGTE